MADLHDAGFGDVSLRYTEQAVLDPMASRLSLSLPVRDQAYPAVGPGGRWARALLPEGRALAWAVTTYGIPEDDRYGLLAEIGRDVAGAVQVLKPDASAPEAGSYEAITTDELEDLITRTHNEGLGLDRERGVRLSLAGMQDKVLLHAERDQLLRPIDGAPSTLILKPEPPDGGQSLPGVATNELYCLELARTCNMAAATGRVERVGERQVLFVNRYDRSQPDGPGTPVRRTHQEDLLGAMGMDPLLKYERPHIDRLSPGGGFATSDAVTARGGPALRDLAGLIAGHLGRARVLGFLEAVTFNVAIGNADAHARNYSILLPEHGVPEFAPLYDLICTCYWPHLDADFAQTISGVDDLEEITTEAIVAEAASWGLPATVAQARVMDILKAVHAHAGSAATRCGELGGDPRVSAEIADLVRGRTTRLLATAR